ncbi:glutathione peroxidase [Rhodocista pekingensis]|uniref:Glutathione peroxidase n=1 Tax=Rhodocista pekingensis TaxID=201185 RepID=A0ABW2KQP1_9PROT
MRRLALMFSLLVAALSTGPAATAATTGAHAFSFVSIDGRPLPLSDFAGRAVLVVNTASQCGFTPQYEGLEALWQQYRDRGLVVLGVPSNDFGGQEPGSAAEIKTFCETTFGIDFPMTDKVVVKGGDAHPFYRWAAAAKGAPRWNFHKYLIGPDGALLAGFGSDVRPESAELRTAIEDALPR